ncbi:Uma2 family endonuclease [Dolichospermum sp. LEGE 00246]|uniref:Uma2 family endonuclease n=1 Tax=Dolichospermum sp. LEGE 00246 TaxID=1828605 RepID=UPI001D14E1D7|nr:Uma2 family endonuclease [Dolichospermum sp. LEGE 00246]MDK2412058.1 Uma2 family endonuclease [Aphanizomenon sp. 202]MDK2460001.1 Uma2 family endonuclease [Aphanizomenon sp. PH219]
MIAAKDNAHLTPEEYFTWEEQQLEKHELIDGQVYAMTGGSVNHSRIAIRFTTMVDTHLDASSCITGNSGLRVNIVGTNNYTYPDVSVTCDDHDKTKTQYITYPCLIVEVLSKTTEAYDRGGKFRMYQNNPVLKDYLLVSSTAIEIDLYHKNDAGQWMIINYGEAKKHQSQLPFYKTYPKSPKSRHIWTAIILVFISCFIAVLE